MQADVNANNDNLSSAIGSGAMLREAREQRQLTVEDVAHTLRLTPQIILALEAGDFSSLGPAVFVRGYLRNYAKLLELPSHLALAESPPAHVEPEEFRTLSIPTEIKPGVNLHRWVFGALLVLALLIVVVVLLAGRPDQAVNSPAAGASAIAGTPAPTIPPSASANGGGIGGDAAATRAEDATPVAPADTPNNAVENSPVSSSDSISAMATEPATAEVIAAEATPAEPLAAAQATGAAAAETPSEPAVTAANGMVPLRLTFTDECWVEIADSRGSLLYGLEKGGSVVDLEGVPPFRIFVGNRGAVQVAVAGSSFPIPAGTQDDGNTARFTIEEAQF